ncbi:BrnA antitoxin family protein [Tsuneonella sp. CC-YZS046]|uniref:BrnA antitoxin family protein n=1 Tax=Tsuneonella sp. CC-YZS046 TaxID=3042152 RepID=UPI002D76D99B|nr:BrnA antitoxin family protein [Tsuneonella sp. CC-YZS046]WRO65720.1 BrnA antitoxin family protein [Tsuneonella sp. CC-YZS046]
MNKPFDDNPEWTKEDFARARPADQVHPKHVLNALVRKPGRPAGSTKPDAKQLISLRLDKDIIAKFKAGGPGWQSRMNEALRKAAEKAAR